MGRRDAGLQLRSQTSLARLVGLVIGLLIWSFSTSAILMPWVMCLIKAYQGQYYKLPVIGNFAEKFSAK